MNNLYTNMMRAACESLTDALLRLDGERQATIDRALKHGATLGLEAQLLPVPALFLVLNEREGQRRVLAEILPPGVNGGTAGASLQ